MISLIKVKVVGGRKNADWLVQGRQHLVLLQQFGRNANWVASARKHLVLA